MNNEIVKKRRTLTLKKTIDVDLENLARKNLKQSNIDVQKNTEKQEVSYSGKGYGDDVLDIIKKNDSHISKSYDEKVVSNKLKDLNKNQVRSSERNIKIFRKNSQLAFDKISKNQEKNLQSVDKIVIDHKDEKDEIDTDFVKQSEKSKKKTSKVDIDLSKSYSDILKQASTGNNDLNISIRDSDADDPVAIKKTIANKKHNIAVERLGKNTDSETDDDSFSEEEMQIMTDYHKERDKNIPSESETKKKRDDVATTSVKNWKLALNQNVNDEERQRVRELMHKRQRRGRVRHSRFENPKLKKIIKVEQGQSMSPAYLASLMGEKNKTIEYVMRSNQISVDDHGLICFDSIEFIIDTCGHKIDIVESISLEDRFIDMVRATKKEFSDEKEKFARRTPVVTIMGHVDHGKTSLLDYFRNSRVIDGEAGGITQHIGAYKVHTASGNVITFLDTPGHEAFSKIRARGANVTDIVLLIVAADDGVMPQTIEAINHIKAASVPMMVVINKIDRPNTNIEKLITQLSQYEIISDEWGGEHIFVKISAKTGENVETLEENIILQAEMNDLEGNPEGNAVGVVLETKIHPKKGYCATLLIQKGELKIGDNLVAGTSVCTVRNLINDINRSVQSAKICEPVEVFGFDSLPESGEYFAVMDDLQDVRNLAEERIERKKQPQSEKRPFDFFGAVDKKEKKSISFIVKADTQGSLDAIIQSIEKLETDEMDINIAGTGVGIVTNSDLDLASITSSRIIVFNAKVDNNIDETAKNARIEIWKYNIIYNIIDDVNALINNVLGPIISENKVGEAVVKQVFGKTKSGSICGCQVRKGMLKRLLVRVLRNNEVIHDNGNFRTLRKDNEDMTEIRAGFECGLIVDNFFDAQAGDQIHVIEIIEESRN